MTNPILRAFFPDRCPVCDRAIADNGPLCPDCAGLRIPAARGAKCDVCGLPPKECVCGRQLYYEKAAFPFFYRNAVRGSLQKLKFRNRVDLAAAFSAEMARAARERGITEDADVVTFIPARRSSVFWRGYNQAELLARGVAKETGLPFEALLYKCEKTEKQHDLRMARRRGNVLGAFEPVPGAEPRIEGKTVVLVDDILTTGNTTNEAAKTLLIFGAEKVYVLCAAARQKTRSKDK